MRELRLKEGNNRLVKRVLQDVMDCHAEVVLQAHQRIRKQTQWAGCTWVIVHQMRYQASSHVNMVLVYSKTRLLMAIYARAGLDIKSKL